ncbi:MAG: hypothetical protein FD131_4205 [Rhodocyclaceae bacterium]|nr:MAG: hypothetical protein FD131_4205 [Rhodocyclaceae bacterium]
MLNKNINVQMPADRATKVQFAIFIVIFTSALAGFAISSYAATHAVWMVPSIYLFGWFLYNAIASGKVKVGDARGIASTMHEPKNTNVAMSLAQEEIPAPMPAGIFFSHAEAVSARGGYDDGSSITYGTNSNGSVTPYAM